MSAALFFFDDNKNFITVREGSVKNTFTFWRIKATDPAGRGNRVKTRPMVFFDTPEEATEALVQYARDRGWPKAPGDALAQAVNKHKSKKCKKDSGFMPLFAWQDSEYAGKALAHADHMKRVRALDVGLYNRYKDQLEEEMFQLVSSKGSELFRAYDQAKIIVAGKKIFTADQIRLLETKIANDTGKPVNGKYLWENCMGGVAVRVETRLERTCSC